MTIKRGPQPAATGITEAERAAFEQLYQAGAWTLGEARQHLPSQRLLQLVRQEYLTGIQTGLGRLIFLRALGRIAAFGTCDKPEAFSRQLDRAYLRLALAGLGWTRLSTRTLLQHDTTGRMWEVLTPSGAVLVTGVYGTGSGYTREGLQRIVERLRSTALFHGLRVVVLTPSARRGQNLAAKHGSWLRLIHCLPTTSPERRVQRQEGWQNMAPPPDEPFPVQGPTADARRQTRAERIQGAKEGLLVDTVLSGLQLRRWYGLEPSDLEGVPYVEALVRPVHAQYGLEVATRFYLASSRLQSLHDHDLGHRAGVAEIRRQLGVPPVPGEWEVEARGRLRYEEPDAVWRSPAGDVAVEYDTGSYTLSKLETKFGTFRDRGFEQTVLGVPSHHRRARLSARLGHDVLLTRWFDPGSS